jgi:outer membrane immunogenic protein
MKNIAITAVSAAALFAAAPALADSPDYNGTSYYGTLGYTDLDGRDANLGAITGRVGARFGRFFGVEGELSGGVTKDHVDVAGTSVGARIEDQYAGYAVGYLPITPRADLFARIGYGDTRFKASAPGISANGAVDSVNYGVGGQYMLDSHNGLRADYTRYDYQRSGGDADVWSVAYVRKF